MCAGPIAHVPDRSKGLLTEGPSLTLGMPEQKIAITYYLRIPMTSPRPHLPAEARREVTVEAVLALAAEQNPTDITTAAIAKRIARTLLEGYGARLAALLEQLRRRGGLRAGLDTGDAVVTFIGAVQGLAMQSLIAGDISRIRTQAPAVFDIYRRGTGA